MEAKGAAPLWRAEEHFPVMTRGIFGRLRRDSIKQWHEFTHHPFVEGLLDGSLPQENFRRFLIQDYLYLVQYARVYALMLYKSPCITSMQRVLRHLETLLTKELALHRAYCQEWGISEDALSQAPASLELQAYTGFLLDRAQTGDILDIHVIMAPCIMGYAEIGARLLHQMKARATNTPYQPWIELYGSEEFEHMAYETSDDLEEAAARYGGEGRYPSLLSEFRCAVGLESAFWESGNPSSRA